MLILSTVMPALFPAMSVAPPATAWLGPSPVTATLDGQVAIPERASLQVKWTTTEPLYQPAALGLVVTAPVMVGAVLSSLMSTVSVLTLLAPSMALAITTWPPVSVLIVLVPVRTVAVGVPGGGVATTTPSIATLRTPEPVLPSSAVNETITLALFQPLSLADGLSAWLNEGGATS